MPAPQRWTRHLAAPNSQIASGAVVTHAEATRLIKVLPHLPGLEPSSPLSLAVFDCLLTNAHSPGTKLHSLVSASA